MCAITSLQSFVPVTKLIFDAFMPTLGAVAALNTRPACKFWKKSAP